MARVAAVLTGSDATRSGRHEHALAQQSPRQCELLVRVQPGQRRRREDVAGQHRLDRVLGGGGQLDCPVEEPKLQLAAAAGDPAPQIAPQPQAAVSGRASRRPAAGRAGPSGAGLVWAVTSSATAAATASTAAEPAADARCAARADNGRRQLRRQHLRVAEIDAHRQRRSASAGVVLRSRDELLDEMVTGYRMDADGQVDGDLAERVRRVQVAARQVERSRLAPARRRSAAARRPARQPRLDAVATADRAAG